MDDDLLMRHDVPQVVVLCAQAIEESHRVNLAGGSWLSGSVKVLDSPFRDSPA